ncbi:MAG: saccharopine dehydrogenase NADP-binding domain-containing protein [Bacteroidia bacterium]|nr:saccharopine dehydrogenase NADP-binding domain-containing protein [Bacteroidia bacterium]
MRKIAVLGIGRSSWYLLDYLNKRAAENNWTVMACDLNAELLAEKTKGLVHVTPLELDIQNAEHLRGVIQDADLVVSLLPPSMHPQIAAHCLDMGKHLATASYVSEAMAKLDLEAQKRGITFLNEMGLDPGIDHMSAMKAIHDLKAHGAEIVSFESYCGGLIHPEDSNGNPWQYKFSWNPQNVILAAQGGMTMFKRNGELHCVPWNRVFESFTTVSNPSNEVFDAYPNRDSLSYMKPYGLESVRTFIRGTLRRKGFCSAWQVFVLLGFTDNNTVLPKEINTPGKLIDCITGRKFGLAFSEWLIENGFINVEQKFYFDYLEFDLPLNLQLAGTAAQMLQQWLSVKWELQEKDRDQVVMLHKIGYQLHGQSHELNSYMELSGLDTHHTAMAKTVGLPLAMGVELILTQKMPVGVQVPTSEIWYSPVLNLLEKEGIGFKEFTL